MVCTRYLVYSICTPYNSTIILVVDTSLSLADNNKLHVVVVVVVDVRIYTAAAVYHTRIKIASSSRTAQLAAGEVAREDERDPSIRIIIYL